MSGFVPAKSIRTLTAILPAESAAVEALRAALHGKGVLTFTSHRARGALPGSPLSSKNEPIWQEMVILEAILPAEEADRIFEEVHAQSLESNDTGGLLFMGRPGLGTLP